MFLVDYLVLWPILFKEFIPVHVLEGVFKDMVILHPVKNKIIKKALSRLFNGFQRYHLVLFSMPKNPIRFKAGARRMSLFTRDSCFMA